MPAGEIYYSSIKFDSQSSHLENNTVGDLNVLFKYHGTGQIL